MLQIFTTDDVVEGKKNPNKWLSALFYIEYVKLMNKSYF